MSWTYTLNHKAFPPKKPQQIKGERVKIIEDCLEGNLLRFLRRHYKQHNYQFVYSKFFKKLRNKGKTDIIDYLHKHYEWPGHIIEVVNVMRTLNFYYEKPLSLNTLKMAIVIVDLFEMDIFKYNRKRWQKHCNLDLPFKGYSEQYKKWAFKEQKARGFIHVNKFEDWDGYFAHAISNIDTDYIYPVNFPFSSYEIERNRNIPSAYIGHVLVGVQGFTRLEEPRKTRILYKRIKNQ